jgi:Protein of unknown function (DUF2892)
MKNNIATADKIVRVLLAAVFGALYFTKVVTGALGLVLAIVGGVFLVTAAAGFCPIYALLGIGTKQKAR